ncbi:hypothetical protein LTR37_004691 [Vermiconidia calcicola]|uniref:Uncharacterized protein n=1 Tax=Vermiconidia calcicola TaxID=1690605 RepID=A0ACC3NMM0_9PEZI|nr:hypothetical protein LTR37_004691 [Vermiconidia calcicola]
MASMNDTLSHTDAPTTVYVVIETWRHNPGYMYGTRALATLTTISEANTYAEMHVDELKRLTSQDHTDEEARDTRYEIFRGLGITDVERLPDGRKAWRVVWGLEGCWGNGYYESRISVEKQTISWSAGEAERRTPLYGPEGHQ